LQCFATSFTERIGLLGAGREEAVARVIAEQAGLGERVVVLAGRKTLRQVAGLIGRARLFVGGDSGLAHLAVALDVPTVVMFGPSDARKWGVQGGRHAVVRKARACSPCFIFGYHKFCRSIACMADIEPEQVLEACRRVLGGGAPLQNLGE